MIGQPTAAPQTLMPEQKEETHTLLYKHGRLPMSGGIMSLKEPIAVSF